MRKIAIVVGIVVLVLLAAAGIFAATFNVNQYRGQIQSELEKRLGRSVGLGNMHLGVFPLRFRVEEALIGDDPRFTSSKPFVEVRSLDVAVQLLPLLHKEVVVDSLSLQRPTVTLIKNKDGIWNFASLGQPEPSSGQGSQQFSLGKLEIRNGQISVADLQAGSSQVYDHIDVTLENLKPNEPFRLDAAVQLPGGGSQEVRLKGKGGPLLREDPVATPYQGTLDLRQVQIGSLSQFLNVDALAGTDGVLSGQSDLRSQSGNFSSSGQLKIEKAKLHGTELGYPITADYQIADDLASGLLTIHKGNIQLGTTPLMISGTVNAKPAKPIVDLSLKANEVSITELAKLAAVSGGALAPGTDVAGKVNADLNARGSIDKLAFSGTVNGRNVRVSGKDIPQPVQIEAINLDLTPTQIQSSPFNVVSGGTTLNAQFALQQYLSNSPLINASIKAPNAQVQSLLAIAKAWGISGMDKVNGNGTISLDMRASGSLKSVTSAEIMRAINGTTALDVSSLRYSGLDLSRELGMIAGFLQSAQSANGFTDVSPLTGDIVVKNGIAQSNNLHAKLGIGVVTGAGTANLADQTLNLHLTAVLSQSVSQQVGGKGIRGFMNTALANNQGELAIPVLVTGTFQNPKVVPDVQQMAQMRLKGLVPTTTNPVSGVSGLLGNLLGRKGANGQPSQGQVQPTKSAETEQRNTVERMIGILGGKKKQQQQ